MLIACGMCGGIIEPLLYSLAAGGVALLPVLADCCRARRPYVPPQFPASTAAELAELGELFPVNETAE